MPITKITYGYKDVSIVPAEISYVKSRSECNPFTVTTEGLYSGLPIFTAPMASVVSDENIDEFANNGIMFIIPRNIRFEKRYSSMLLSRWVALSLKEFTDLFCIEANIKKKRDFNKGDFNVCIDVANGHMAQIYDACKLAKKLARKYDYRLTIMTGNIANPKTYDWIRRLNNGYREKYKRDENVVDYIRIGIGGGSGCFVDGTMITCANNIKKQIQDVEVGDMVLTHDGTYQMVTSRLRYKTDEDKIRINGDITCTKGHKFYVIDKADVEKVTEDNLNSFAYWIEAHNLNKDKHLLVALESDKGV